MKNESHVLRAAGVVVLVLMAATLTAARADGRPEGVPITNPHLSTTLTPRPGLAPQKVVRIQLEALRNNDGEDRGIEVAFRFASPSNKLSTGPLPRFARMVKEGPYALMLNFVTAAYEPLDQAGDLARQRVTLFGSRRAVTFVFYLTRQSEGPCVDCWMTEAVTVEPFEGLRARLTAWHPDRSGARADRSI